MPSISSAEMRVNCPNTARVSAHTAVSAALASVISDMRPKRPVAWNSAMTAPPSAVATTPSSASCNGRPLAVTPTTGTPNGTASSATTATTVTARPRRGQKKLQARSAPASARGQAAAMRWTAGSVSPPSASAPTMPTVAASTAYTPYPSGPSAWAISTLATKPSASRSRPADQHRPAARERVQHPRTTSPRLRQHRHPPRTHRQQCAVCRPAPVWHSAAPVSPGAQRGAMCGNRNRPVQMPQPGHPAPPCARSVAGCDGSG